VLVKKKGLVHTVPPQALASPVSIISESSSRLIESKKHKLF